MSSLAVHTCCIPFILVTDVVCCLLFQSACWMPMQLLRRIFPHGWQDSWNLHRQFLWHCSIFIHSIPWCRLKVRLFAYDFSYSSASLWWSFPNVGRTFFADVLQAHWRKQCCLQVSVTHKPQPPLRYSWFTYISDISHSNFLNSPSTLVVNSFGATSASLASWPETFRSFCGGLSCSYISCICPRRVLCKPPLFLGLSVLPVLQQCLPSQTSLFFFIY